MPSLLPHDIYHGRSASRWLPAKGREYTKTVQKRDLHDPDNHDGVITNLEPDIVECEVKWTLESITTNKASGGDGIQFIYFKS